MPKELTHFLVAEKAAAHLREIPLGHAAAREPDALLFGSIFQDVLYYTVSGHASGVAGIPDLFHKAETGLNCVRLQADLLREQPGNAVRGALLLGMLSHVCADAALHPLITYLTGDYDDPHPMRRSRARQHHRALESLLDMILCPEGVGNRRYALRRIGGWHGNRFSEALPLEGMAHASGVSLPVISSAMRSSWHNYAALQWLASSRPVAQAAFAMRPLLPRSVREITALFYAPQLLPQADPLAKDIDYRHPETGRREQTTLVALVDAAVAETVRLGRALEAFLRGEAYPEDIPASDVGVKTSLTHFAPAPFPRLS